MPQQKNNNPEFLATDKELQDILTNILQKDLSSSKKKKKNQPKCGQRYITYLEEISYKDIYTPSSPPNNSI